MPSIHPLARRRVFSACKRLLPTGHRCLSTAPFSLRPLADGPTHFGREVVGLDLASDALPASELVAALYEHGLLLIRGTQHLTPDHEMRFARLFTHQPDDAGQSYTGGAGTQHRLPEFPSIALVGTYAVEDFHGLTASSPGVYSGWHPEQRAWHCDGLADTDPPPDLTTMRCLRTPSAGGETLFACSVKAAELLPPTLRPPPDDVTVHYRLFGRYEIAREGTHLLSASGAKGEGEQAWDVNLAGGTRVPLVVREPVSGKRALVGSYHVAALSVAGGGEGGEGGEGGGRQLGFAAANAYVAAAWAPGLAPELVYAHRWRVGDLVAWSNRLVIHTATSTSAYASTGTDGAPRSCGLAHAAPRVPLPVSALTRG
eukprot:Transcript_29748.p1 GENE.Transcript_29748~~Transcript_29748.p1  ORF type:complete len:371 (-),score=86.17 Transcript_29748:219-1331(-)